MKRHAFSLVELSIVLVILGLLAGGVLSGQSLIRASELRSIGRDEQRYVAATQSFRDKYFALPGDMTNATSFWNSDTCPGTAGSTTTTSLTCNGNGNGSIDYTMANFEQFRYWQQLSDAGLIEGTFTGVSTDTSPNYRGSTPGVNIPKLHISNSGISVETWGAYTGDPYRWDGSYGTVFIVGAMYPGAPATTPTEYPIFKAEDAWNIDTKFDDGNPVTGSVRTNRKMPTSPWVNCTTTNIEATSHYNVTDSSISCDLIFANVF